METTWFCIVAVMLAVYAILDGSDLGSGVLHLFVARSESDRRSLRAAAGPFWDGNELWLLLAASVLYVAFPAIYSSRGFSLAAMATACFLLLRWMTMAFRQQVSTMRRRQLLDALFAFSSVVAVLSLGVTVGFLVCGPSNWLPLLCGVSALAAMTLQSASWMALKTSGELQLRCRHLASGIWWFVLLGYVSAAATGLAAHPHALDNLLENSWISGLAVLSVAGLLGARLCLSVDFDLGVFASASCVIAGLLASAAAGQFPQLLRTSTIYHAGAAWWIPAFALAAGFNVSMHRLFRSHPNGRLIPALLRDRPVRS